MASLLRLKQDREKDHREHSSLSQKPDAHHLGDHSDVLRASLELFLLSGNHSSLNNATGPADEALASCSRDKANVGDGGSGGSSGVEAHAFEWHFWTQALAVAASMIEKRCPAALGISMEEVLPSSTGSADGSGADGVGRQRCPQGGRRRSTHLAVWEGVWAWASTTTCADAASRNDSASSVPAPSSCPLWCLVALATHLADNARRCYTSSAQQPQSPPPYLTLLFVNQLQWLVRQVQSVLMQVGVEPQRNKEDQHEDDIMAYAESDTAQLAQRLKRLAAHLEQLILHALSAAMSSMIEDLQCFSLALVRHLHPSPHSNTPGGGGAAAPSSLGPLIGRARSHVSSFQDTVGQWMAPLTFWGIASCIVDGSIEPVLNRVLQDEALLTSLTTQSLSSPTLSSPTHAWLRTLLRECEGVLKAAAAAHVSDDERRGGTTDGQVPKVSQRNLSTLRQLLIQSS